MRVPCYSRCLIHLQVDLKGSEVTERKSVQFGSAVSERDTSEKKLQKANERVSANILKENSNISMTDNDIIIKHNKSNACLVCHLYIFIKLSQRWREQLVKLITSLTRKRT